MIKLALVGIGSMGKLHLKNIKELEKYNLCKLTCICDINKDLTDNYANDLQIKGYYNIEKMIEENIFDAAIVAVTSVNHFSVSKLLLQNDKPVLIEKPVVISIKEAEELQRISEQKNILISAGFTEVYNSVTTGVKNYLKDDGYLNYIDFFRIGQKTKKNDTKDIDVIQDLLTHDLAVLSELIDITAIREVCGKLSCYNKYSNKYDLANVNIVFDNEIIARFLVDRSSSVKIRKFNISSDDMYGEFNFMDQTANIMKKGTIEAFGDNIWYSQNFDCANIRYSNNPLMDEIKDFIIAVQNKVDTKTSKKWFQITKSIENIRRILYSNEECLEEVSITNIGVD